MRHVMLSLIILLCSLATAEIPQMMSYQGKVTDAGGNPVADGPYSMQFLLYEQEAGGSPVWDSGPQTVGVMGGVFSVLLGAPPQPPIGYPFVGDTWLEVTIGGDVQTPRVKLGSVAYAYMASGLMPGTMIEGSDASQAMIGVRNTSPTGYAFGGEFEARGDLGIAVYAHAQSTTGTTMGVYGTIQSTAGQGVYGVATSQAGTTYGVYGASYSSEGSGIYGHAAATSGNAYGVKGTSASEDAGGVYGEGVWGVYGKCLSDWGWGVAGVVTSGTGSTTGVYGFCSSPNGVGVEGKGVNGVRGEAMEVNGYGVLGTATATSGTADAVRGEASATGGRGVHGIASSSSGQTYAGLFEEYSPDGAGVCGRAMATTGPAPGGHFSSSSTSGTGVVGLATATTGTISGVYGRSQSTSGKGVYGVANTTTGVVDGVCGETPSDCGRGVVGKATATAGQTYGVWGEVTSSEGAGVYGHSWWGHGVIGQSHGDGRYGVVGAQSGYTPLELGWQLGSTGGFFGGDEFGVFGYSEGAMNGAAVGGETGESSVWSPGVSGTSHSPTAAGVEGWAYASSGATYGVFGSSWSSGGCGVYYSGGLAGTGTKSCVVSTSRGPTLLYCQESPENWFEDVGEGQLADGRAHVELDPLFVETVTIDGQNQMKVFVQLGGDCRGVYVERGTKGFDVIEFQGGTSSVPFTYRVMAKRKGFEARRLDYCKAAERDSYLHPELRDKERQEYEARRVRMDYERNLTPQTVRSPEAHGQTDE